MHQIRTAEFLLGEMIRLLKKVDEADAPAAAAYLDSAIDALCRELSLDRDTSVMD